ncbi:MAG: hypothetical protein ACOC1N_05030 [Bacillota bacterium]
MLLDNRITKIIFNNIAVGLGLALLVIGSSMLFSQVSYESNIPQSARKIDISSLNLSYDRLDSINESEIVINIPSGSSGFTVANILDENGIMPAEEFRKYLLLFDIENKLRAGKYKFNKNDSYADILNKIVN